MRRVRHFGNTIVHLGITDIQQDNGPSNASGNDSMELDASGGSEKESGKEEGPCSKGMCQAMAAASKLAMGALGPAGQLIGGEQLEALKNDKSPAGQAQYQAALAHNAAVTQQNAERSAIIDQFVKDAVGGQVTPEQMRMGDGAIAAFESMKAKYGPELDYMTLRELVNAYPEDAKAVVSSLGQIFPALKGKSFEQIWATIPETFKDMQMIDLIHAIPNSSWAGTKTTTGASVASGTSKTAMVGGLAALAALAFVFLRRN